MIKIAICDDDEIFLQQEKKIIQNYFVKNPREYNVDSYTSGKDLLKSEELNTYDIVFLDISMDEIDGLEIARIIRKWNQNVYLIFITGYVIFSLEGYKVDAVRYILKNDKLLIDSIEESLDCILQKMELKEKKYVFPFQEGKKEIKLSDIVYLESNLHKIVFHMKTSKLKKFTMYGKLDEVAELFDELQFCRIHKSFLVNMRYSAKIERYKLYLHDGTQLNIAKPRYHVTEETFFHNIEVF
ncbi:MAG: LytR/AlgR family response regulator transcription factor [Lachnospiraceae bacterium]